MDAWSWSFSRVSDVVESVLGEGMTRKEAVRAYEQVSRWPVEYDLRVL